jgi:hypothetical protein
MQRLIKFTSMAAALVVMLPLFCIGSQRSAIEPSAAANPGWKDIYVGEWSNGRGETLVISGSTIKFANDKAVSYRDVTRVTNGREFHLEITTDAKLNYLTKFLHVSFGEGEKTDEMKMTLYNSRKDMEDGENSQGEATWYRDK